MSPSAFVPLALMLLAISIPSVYDNVQLRRERAVLANRYAAQRQPLEDAQTQRLQLESIAGATAALAEQGNENAIRVREHLRRQGVTISPPTAGGAALPGNARR